MKGSAPHSRFGDRARAAAALRLVRESRTAMKQERPGVPPEAIEAYNLYIHGNIDRRTFLDRVARVAASALAASAIVDQLMPNYAAAQQVSPDDARLKTERVTIPSPEGN